jgi:hypothetical protein
MNTGDLIGHRRWYPIRLKERKVTTHILLKLALWSGILLAGVLFLFDVNGMAQSTPHTLTVSGGTASTCNSNPATAPAGACVEILNPNGLTAAGFEELPIGTVSGVSVIAQGCMRGGTCDSAADTNTGTSAVIRGVVFSKVYDFFLITGTFTGSGFTINSRVGNLPAASSASSVTIAGPLG